MFTVAISPPGGPELIIILVVLVLLFGAKKLPELGSSIGTTIKNFKKGIEDSKDDVPDGDGAPNEQVTEKSRRTTEQ